MELLFLLEIETLNYIIVSRFSQICKRDDSEKNKGKIIK